MNDNFTAVVVAGGKSERMGFDKQILKKEETTIFEKNLNVLLEIFPKVLVISNKPELYENYQVNVYEDIIPGGGPLSGIHSALTYAETQYIFAVACDMPYLDISYIKYLMEVTMRERSDACVTRFGDWIEPFNGIYGKNIVSVIEDNLRQGNRSVYKMLQKVNTYYISEQEARKFSPDWKMFTNINTREELEKYLAGAM